MLYFFLYNIYGYNGYLLLYIFVLNLYHNLPHGIAAALFNFASNFRSGFYLQSQTMLLQNGMKGKSNDFYCRNSLLSVFSFSEVFGI